MKADEKTSYSIGVLIGASISKQVRAEELNFEALTRGMQQVLLGQNLEMDPAEAQQVAMQYMQEVEASANADAKAIEDKFFEANAQNEGVEQHESGMQYKVLTTGSGAKPALTDNVTVHYHGTLTNGQVFDSSVERGQPATFPLNNLIPAWQKALPMMTEGSKWRLFVPSEMAYGPQGSGPIPPYATLIFDIELIKVG